jgi:selenocysteine-specific elongation factor
VGSASHRYVIGTAGHIDHGKTALVKALTGVDTDRWEEEKRRGITIDLGFAPLALGDDLEASVVDVPGHEGFVRNMLAGATGIDVALLVVAADEGVMPQTEEHLAIVELLGVRIGIPVLTKRDLVEPEWLGLVETELVERLRSSRVRWAPPIATSVVTGEGLDGVRAALRSAAVEVVERPVDDLFRLPIDRVFSRAGAGTVVTGSTWSGTVGVGDSVRIVPSDRTVRVRSIQVHGHAAERALPGRRTALALVGVERDALSRGDVVVTGAGWTGGALRRGGVVTRRPSTAAEPNACAPASGDRGGAGARVPGWVHRSRVARPRADGPRVSGGCPRRRPVRDPQLFPREHDRRRDRPGPGSPEAPTAARAPAQRRPKSG